MNELEREWQAVQQTLEEATPKFQKFITLGNKARQILKDIDKARGLARRGRWEQVKQVSARLGPRVKEFNEDIKALGG